MITKTEIIQQCNCDMTDIIELQIKIDELIFIFNDVISLSFESLENNTDIGLIVVSYHDKPSSSLPIPYDVSEFEIKPIHKCNCKECKCKECN